MASPQKFYNNPFTICIEGNIGSGKTTFLNHFQNFNNATILQEPVDLWRNVAGVNLLVSFSAVTAFEIYLILKCQQIYMTEPYSFKKFNIITEKNIFTCHTDTKRKAI